MIRSSLSSRKARFLLTHEQDSWEFEANDKAEAGEIVRLLLDEKAGLVGVTDFDTLYSNRIDFMWNQAQETFIESINDTQLYKKIA